MITRILHASSFLYKVWYMLYPIIVFAMIIACSDNSEVYICNQDKANIIQLSIPDAELVQVRSIATERECIIEDIQVFVYNDTHTAAPMYYQEGKRNELSFLFGNGTASPTITLKDYVPHNGDRIYVVCNLTNNASVSGEGDFLLETTISETQLRSYNSQGKIEGFSGLQGKERTFPMYGWVEWNEKATSNVCLLTRCLAKVTVDAGADLFSGKQVYWEWRNLNYSDFVLDSEYQGIYQGAINDVGISGKYDLVSATTPVDETVGLVTTYYPLEYKHSVYALGNEVDEKTFSKDRAMLLLTVQNPDGSNREYYRLDIWDKETGKYLDIVRNHSYRFNIAKVKSRGYASEQEAYQNPGSNIEYTITVTDQWSQGFVSNGQYLVKTDREKIELIESGIKDPVTMVKFELQADETGNVDLNNVTTRKVRILNSDKETLVSSSDVCLFYSVDNQNLMQAKGEDGLPINEANLPQGSDVYWIYCTVPEGSSLKEGFLQISVGNIVKYIPFSIIPHTEAIAVDEDGPANCFITPVTYGVYSFDATVIGNGTDGIVAETRERRAWTEELGEDIDMYHFKNAYGEDISVSKNVGITPKSAKLIWQDKENVISQVAFNTVTRRVEFLSHDAGNGIIAVYDNSDPNAEGAKVLWSWHIWCTEKPEVIELGLPTNGETYSGKNYKIMDRDLGATTSTPDKLTTRGLGYQWGRKDPFSIPDSFESTEEAFIYNVRGGKFKHIEIEKNENIGTIEYAINHPEVFIISDDAYSAHDWLYYISHISHYDNSFMTGNQYLWGNNPFSMYKMVNIKSMKTLYDPCPAGYTAPPSDVYCAFLRNPIIESPVKNLNNSNRKDEYYGKEIENTDYYTPLFTKYGAYFYCGGDNSSQKVYFITSPNRYGRTELNGYYDFGYNCHLCGTLMRDFGSGMNVVMTFGFYESNVYYSFGAGRSVFIDRSAAAQVRCVRDE